MARVSVIFDLSRSVHVSSFGAAFQFLRLLSFLKFVTSLFSLRICKEDMLIELSLASILACLVACWEPFEKEEEPLEAILFYLD